MYCILILNRIGYCNHVYHFQTSTNVPLYAIHPLSTRCPSLYYPYAVPNPNIAMLRYHDFCPTHKRPILRFMQTRCYAEKSRRGKKRKETPDKMQHFYLVLKNPSPPSPAPPGFQGRCTPSFSPPHHTSPQRDNHWASNRHPDTEARAPFLSYSPPLRPNPRTSSSSASVRPPPSSSVSFARLLFRAGGVARAPMSAGELLQR